MKFILSALLFLFSVDQSIGQSDFIQIETNKTLCLFSFLETSSGQQGVSRSFQQYIQESFKEDEKFAELVANYSELVLRYSIERSELPEKRPSASSTKQLLWVAASNSTSIDDFSNRIIGYLPHQTQIQLIELMKAAERYYDELVWENEQENIKRLETQLGEHTNEISDLFLKVSNFYNTPWDTSIPFKVMVYPIPLNQGETTALPMGNALICSFLSHQEGDYKSTLGIIIHEMCHILFDEQTPDFQRSIDDWFAESDSPYASLAYSFINEGLATVLGNGWAYQQIHGELDSADWYNNKHINGFGHALFPLTEEYMNAGKSIDQHFINKAIDLFAETFPKALEETAILLNTVQILANTEEESDFNALFGIYNYFNVRSMGLSTPIMDPQSLEYLDKKEKTKLLIVDSNNSRTMKALRKHYSLRKMKTPLNTIEVFKHDESLSTIIVINIDGIEKLESAYSTLGAIEYIEYEKKYDLK